MAWKTTKKAKGKTTSKKRVAYVDLKGDKFYKLSEWKAKNPGQLYFESGLERDCYIELNRSGIDFDFQPDSRELLEAFSTWSFSLKTKKIYRAKVRNMSYTSDFLIHCPDGTRMYIEAKGFFHADSRIRYKLFQSSLKAGEITLLIKSVADLKSIINIIKNDFSDKSKTKLKNITL